LKKSNADLLKAQKLAIKKKEEIERTIGENKNIIEETTRLE